MGEYTEVKRRRMIQLLVWLNTKEDIEVNNGGNHQWVVKHDAWNRPFPIPFKHNTVSKHIVKALMKKVVDLGVCTKEEFDKHL